MKKSVASFVIALSASASQASPAFAQALAPAEVARPVEVALSNVFLPATGYDDNDNVLALVDGLLPNGCYSLGHTETVAKPQGFALRQFALRKVDGVCAPGQELPADVAAPVPFSHEISFGRLESGSYAIEFASREGGRKTRNFGVEKARVASVDNLRYAAITSVYVPDILSASTEAGEFKLLLAGLLTSSCVELADEIKVERVDDVIVVLPPTKTVFSGSCLPFTRSFATEVAIAIPPAGRYMIHVRSLNGNAVSRLFTVR